MYIYRYLYFFLLIFLKTTLKASRRGESNIVCVYHVGLFFAYKQLVHLSLVFGKSSKRLKRDLTSTKPVSALFVGKIRKKPQEEELFYGRGAKAKLTKFFPSLLSSILLLVCTTIQLHFAIRLLKRNDYVENELRATNICRPCWIVVTFP